MNEKKKQEYADKVMPGNGWGGSHFAIFPNVVIDNRRILPWHPHGVGVTEFDDMENWNYAFPASPGAVAGKLPYNFAMGIGRGRNDDRVPGFTLNFRMSEEPARARFSRWISFMKANSWDDLYPIKKTPEGANKLFR